jgi:asparagine synthase (glutamine-hydrolysing)
MSIIWGVIRFDNEHVTEDELLELSAPVSRYGDGAPVTKLGGKAGMGFLPFHTHERSLLEKAPNSDLAGNLISFDGRLDNYRQLARSLDVNESMQDSLIALAAFRQWGEDCFSLFTGDWACSLWSKREERLLLARDHAGARTLYWERHALGIRWSTYLDSLTELNQKTSLSKQFAANYLSCRPNRELTPFDNLSGIRPGHYVSIHQGRVMQSAHWSPLIKEIVRYESDEAYDERFLELFGQSVARRTGSGAAILAQLSGGMDSTSIVCMSDHLRRLQDPNIELLDTISYYDDSESSLDEKTYFEITESRRGKTGTHFNTAISQRTFDPPISSDGAYPLPGADSFSVSQEGVMWERVWRKGYKTVLSGVGGDEVLGGIPDPVPELATHLANGDLTNYLNQSLKWCLSDRTPLILSFRDSIRFVYDLYRRGKLSPRPLAPWITPELRDIGNQLDDAYVRLPDRLKALPHQLDNALSWWAVMETLPHLNPQIQFRPEYRYPMLDKDLITFLFSIPREQLLRPGRRRALMRRALRHIVPTEILERRRKAFQLRAPLNALQQSHEKLQRLFANSLLAEQGLVDIDSLRQELMRCANGAPEWTQSLLRTIACELWLRSRLVKKT